jgi:proliferating cell nuclear antigen
MDSSHVSLCALVMSASGFDEFTCTRPTTLGVNMVNLAKILKCSSGDDAVTLQCKDGGNSFDLLFEGKSKTSEFCIQLVDIDSEHLGIPEREDSCRITMASAEFQRICRDLAVIGDSCTIACAADSVTFSVAGDRGVGNIHLKRTGGGATQDDAVVIESTEPVKLAFAMRHLNIFTKATPLAATVQLSMASNLPLVVEYALEKLGFLRFYLAPKIDDQEGGQPGSTAADAAEDAT